MPLGLPPRPERPKSEADKAREKRFEDAAKALEEKNIDIIQTTLASELKLTRERVRQILAKYPDLAKKIGTELSAVHHERRIRAAGEQVAAENKARTSSNFAEILGITEQSLNNHLKAHPELKRSLGIMSEHEFNFYKYRVAATVLDEIGLPVTRTHIANLLLENVNAVREFIGRNAKLIGELGIQREKPNSKDQFLIPKVTDEDDKLRFPEEDEEYYELDDSEKIEDVDLVRSLENIQRDKVIAFLLASGNTLKTVQSIFSSGDFGKSLKIATLKALIGSYGNEDLFIQANPYMDLDPALIDILTKRAKKAQPRKLYGEERERVPFTYESDKSFDPGRFDSRWTDTAISLLAHLKTLGFPDDVIGKALSEALSDGRRKFTYTDAGSVARRVFGDDADTYLRTDKQLGLEVRPELFTKAAKAARHFLDEHRKIAQTQKNPDKQAPMNEWIESQHTKLVQALLAKDIHKAPPLTHLLFYKKSGMSVARIILHIVTVSEVKKEESGGEVVIPKKRDVQLNLSARLKDEFDRMRHGDVTPLSVVFSGNEPLERIELYHAESKKVVGIGKELIAEYSSSTS